LKVDTIKKQTDFYTVNVKNIGGFAIPFDIKITYADGETVSMHETPAVWKNNEREQVFKISSQKIIKSVELDGGIFMDYTPGDNIWKQ
jgi:hypothetical protein